MVPTAPLGWEHCAVARQSPSRAHSPRPPLSVAILDCQYDPSLFYSAIGFCLNDIVESGTVKCKIIATVVVLSHYGYGSDPLLFVVIAPVWVTVVIRPLPAYCVGEHIFEFVFRHLFPHRIVSSTEPGLAPQPIIRATKQIVHLRKSTDMRRRPFAVVR
jgi:hypothetical protein